MKADALRRDFGDWISPILVKELRQGLRTRIFAMCYLFSCSVLPLFFVVTAYADQSGAWGDWREGMRYWFWGIASVLFLFVLPLNGLSAIEIEIRTRGLELLSLSELGSGSVVFGKWAALFCQSLLVGAAFLPLCILGYFLGNLELLKELDTLSAMIASSGVVSAGVVFMSRFPMWARVTAILVALFLAAPFAVFLLVIVFYFMPAIIPFFAPIVLMVVFFFTRELIAHPSEPVVRGKWLPAAIALGAPLLLIVPFFRSGLVGIVVLIVFAYTWMQSEKSVKV